MKKTLAAVAFGLSFAGQMAGALTPAEVIADLKADGYTRVEVRVGQSQMKVEAIRGTEKLETVYDISTGAVLKSEREAVGAGENTAPGTSVRERDRDFVRADRGAAGSDDGTPDQGPGNDDDNDSNDDNGGTRNDDDSDDDRNDDKGGDRNDKDRDDDSDDDRDDDNDDDSDDDRDDDDRDDDSDDSSDD